MTTVCISFLLKENAQYFKDHNAFEYVSYIRSVMSPEEFAREMRETFTKDCDKEGAHGHANEVMCEILKALGYEEGVKIFRAADKWYA